MAVMRIGDMTGGGSLLPSTKAAAPAKPRIALGRTPHPTARAIVSSASAAKLARAVPVAPSDAKIDFGGRSGGGPAYASPTSPTASPYDAQANGGSSEGPGAAYYDAGSFNAFTGDGGGVAPSSAAVPSGPVAVQSASAPAQDDTQKMTLAQAQASGPAPVGYYIAGGVAVAAVAAGLYFFTR